jgi:L-amino acid N-acyltransferase YncA
VSPNAPGRDAPRDPGRHARVTELILRAADPSDADQIAAIYAPYVRETPITFEVEAPSGAEMRERMRAVGATYPWLVCSAARGVLGYAYAGRHRERAAYQWSVDVSVYVERGAHRRGIGGALYAALLPLLAEQGFYNAYGGITLPNPPSVGLHEAMGFAPVGAYRGVGYKLGAWHDVGWWAKALRPPTDAPTPPRPIAALRGTPGWEAALAAGRQRLRTP